MSEHASSCSSSSAPIVAVITCAVLEDEIRHFAQACPNVVHVEVLAQGLHNEPPKLRQELQAAVDRVEAAPATAPAAAVQAIVLGYGLCSRGIEGVRTRRCPLVVARAHDCITLLLGSHQRYAAYLAAHPGTYWYSPGWNKHHVPPGKERYDKLYNQYLEKYGPDNAQYLMEVEQQWLRDYNRATWVDLGVSVRHEDLTYTRQCAAWLGWSFDRQDGDPSLLQDMLQGRWDALRFLILQPGQTCEISPDDGVIRAVPADTFPPNQP
ncbi:MAG: DUF1638 domain-containing protein [Phycisphaeraceae bacterium]|nr:DUF1638 domain-containing protein [Phycisphaeraceae bacterium]